MTQKRVPLSERRLQDRKGIDALIGGIAEPPDAAPGQGTAAIGEPKRVEKVTLYVRPDQVVALEEIQLQQRRSTGKKPDKSDLVQQALDLLIQKYSNLS